MNKIQINILIDAVGWEIAQRNNFLSEGFALRKKVKTILGYSSAAQPTILTGKIPAEHTQWSMYYYSPEYSLFRGLGLEALELFPSRIVHNHRIVRKLNYYIEKVKEISAYFNIYCIPFNRLKYFNLAAKKDIYDPAAFDSCLSIFDLLANAKIPYKVWKWNIPTEQAFIELREAIASGKYQFFFLYSPMMDSLMHSVGTKADSAVKKLRWLESEVAAVKKCAEKRGGEVEINVFSDHGMTDTISSYNIMKGVKQLQLTEGKDFLAFYDSTMARFWFFSDIARNKIEDFLRSQTYGKILADDELKNLGVYFEDRRYGERIFLMNPGCLVVPSYMGMSSIAAMHGFSPDDKNSDAMFMSTNSDAEVEHIKDIYFVMENYIKE